jgi:hypothetical protein
VCRLVLRTTARVFDRHLRFFAVSPAAETRDRGRFLAVASARWTHSDPDASCPPLTIELPQIPSDQLWLVVDEGDNSRLPIERPTLLLPADQLRFFRDSHVGLSLLYGAPGMTAPRYDLELIAARLARTPAREVAPGPESDTTPAGRLAVSTTAFWGVLLAAVVVLVGILARLLRPERQTPGSGGETS